MLEFGEYEEIDDFEYMKLAENGARVLLQVGKYRCLDCSRDDVESYVILRFNKNETTSFFQVNIETMYNLVTCHYVAKNDVYLMELINELGI